MDLENTPFHISREHNLQPTSVAITANRAHFTLVSFHVSAPKYSLTTLWNILSYAEIYSVQYELG